MSLSDERTPANCVPYLSLLPVSPPHDVHIPTNLLPGLSLPLESRRLNVNHYYGTRLTDKPIIKIIKIV